ncbi:NAD-binding protein [Neolentinus lepideus HHB14362 ss-1]|uniref:3-oxoacyl-[acyl-carrier-protein] reductase n=1 Tax=Neolentinus lepideus HHB14362 ss-1 TaxID=1314782 RepID=A0A165MTV9_9AGAM|nr:NAD-binding protein [Neolentinus lepideus HHB14362 ss-1]
MSTHSESLRGKLALITGCTGGIGRATALALAHHGLNIAIHYHAASGPAAALADELSSLGVKASYFQADMGSYDAVRRMHAEVVARMGHPDVLFNNAGTARGAVGRAGQIEDVDMETFESTWRVNAGSSFLLTQLCVPHMVTQKFGRIVFNSSVAAATGGVIGPHYASSKSALHGTMHWIAQRYARDGITCNAVAPALIVETSMMSNPNPENLKMIPVGRFGTPAEIASVVEMLVANAYMTNKIVVADGGWTAGAF